MPYIALPVNQVLSDFLKQTGLSQAQLAEKCSVSASTINLILRHDIWPKRQELTEKLEKSMKEIFIQHGAAPTEVNAAFEECASRRMNWTSPPAGSLGHLPRLQAPKPINPRTRICYFASTPSPPTLGNTSILSATRLPMRCVVWPMFS